MTCAVPGCDKPSNRGGGRYCSMHYSRLKRHGDLDYQRPGRAPCKVEGCDKLAQGRGLCGTHWQQWRRRGDPCPTLLRGALWTPEEDRKLLDLPIYPRSGMTRRGETEALALHLGRSVVACRSRLCQLRRERGY